MVTRRLLSRVHRYIGLALGAWFVLLGATGALLLYRDELDRALNPTLLAARATGAPLALAAIRGAALAAYPGASVERIRAPADALQVYVVTLRTEGRRRVGSPRLEAMFDPATGALLGARDPDARALAPTALVHTIYDLHHRLLLGNTGREAVGLAGALLACAIMLGVVLAVPRPRWRALRRAVTIKRRAHAKRMLYDLHRAFGMFVAIPLAVAALTGFFMAFPDYARDAASTVSAVRPLPVVPFRPREVEGPDLGAALAAVERRFGRAAVREVHLPDDRSALLLAYLHSAGDIHRLGDRLVVMDVSSGELLVERGHASRTVGEAALHWLFPLHSGTAFGAVGRSIALLAGLAPLALLLSGCVVWWIKRRAERVAMLRRATRHAAPR